MSLELWTFAGWRTWEARQQAWSPWTWAAVPEGGTPNAEQLAVLDRVDNPRGAAVLRFQQWLDADLSWSWVEDWWNNSESAQTIAEMGSPAQRQAVVAVWQRLSNVLRAANVAPYALSVYREAWERRLGRPTPSYPYGESSEWRQEIERIAGAPPDGLQAGCTVFRPLPSGAVGMVCGNDLPRLRLTSDGAVDATNLDPPEGQGRGFTENTCPVKVDDWACAEWAWKRYCAGGCYAWSSDTDADLYALAPLRWYWDLAREVLDWIRGNGPLGAVWDAHVNAALRNRAQLSALGHSVDDPGWLADQRDALRDAATDRMFEEITGALNLSRVVGAALGSATSVVLGAYAAVSEAVARLLVELGGMAFARFEDVFERPYPVLESAEIRSSRDDVAAIQPLAVTGFTVLPPPPGLVIQRQCGTPGASPPPDCWHPTLGPVPTPPSSGRGWLILGGLAAAGVGGALWLNSRHTRR